MKRQMILYPELLKEEGGEGQKLSAWSFNFAIKKTKQLNSPKVKEGNSENDK